MHSPGRLRHHGFEALRFLIVGGANFLLTLAVFYCMLRLLDPHYLAALFVAWMAGMVFSYTLNFIWVFRPEEKLRFRERFAKYFAANLGSILLNMLALHALVDAIDLDPFLAQCALIPLVVAFNYATSKFWSLRAG